MDVEKGKLAESNWADFFEKCGVHFEYEPHLFELGPNRGFKPDFWFPVSDTYIEVTMTRHINRKNKKLKQAREMYPDKTFMMLTRHEHRVVFGPVEEFPMIYYRLDAWTQVVENMAALIEAIKSSTTSLPVAERPWYF